MIAGDMDAHFAYDQIEHVKVGDVEYVLLPHLAAMSGEFTKEDFTPCLGASKSVLIVHGVAAGDPSLQQQDENKEIPIARWIMEMDWDYVAFGHYHKPGWVPGYRGKAAYCGSLENTVISGPDVCMSRGPVYIDLSKSGEDMLVMHPQKIRPIMDLPVIDLKDREITADELDSEIVALILGNDTDEAIVTHKVVNIPRSLYKSLTRRSFQNVNPSMLYIQTKFEQATETKQVTLTVTNDEGEEVEKVVTVDENGVEVNPEQAFQPLAKEAETMLDAMIMEGNIQASKKDEIMKLINSYLEN
jgi:DNA repair exonuclease SbcCD nuclease subunit